MHSLIGLRPNLETVIALCRPFLKDEGDLSLEALKRAYREYLQDIQPDVPRSSSSEMVFVTGEEESTQLATIFGLEEASVPTGLEGVRDQSGAMPPWKLDMCREGLTLCEDMDTELGYLLQLTIDRVFSVANSQSAGSMTTGSAIGIIWIDPLKHWTPVDVAEAYVHELTHTLINLDERRFGHYHDYALLEDPSNFAVSSIRSERRPLNGSIHSIIVGAEVLTFREKHVGHDARFRLHPSSHVLSRKAREAVDSVKSLPNLDLLITPRLASLLDVAAQRINELARSQTADALLPEDYVVRNTMSR